MTGFVDLQRRFHELSDSDLEDTESLLIWSGSGYGPDIGWSELLEFARVILLAEAGAGKTAEMQQQANRLAGEGRFAFFVPLEPLDREPIAEILSAPDEGRFKQWKADGKEPAWFFLDAVDELKLTEGKLDRALNRLSREIDGHLERAHIIISCRPSDWIADNWTLTKLERALRIQLTGQYLRHPNCRAGCLLLTCHGRKTYWMHPETRKRMKFSELVALLNDKARDVENEPTHGIRIAVFGLDLTDPPLASTHPESS